MLKRVITAVDPLSYRVIAKRVVYAKTSKELGEVSAHAIEQLKGARFFTNTTEQGK